MPNPVLAHHIVIDRTEAADHIGPIGYGVALIVDGKPFPWPLAGSVVVHGNGKDPSALLVVCARQASMHANGDLIIDGRTFPWLTANPGPRISRAHRRIGAQHPLLVHLELLADRITDVYSPRQGVQVGA